MFSIHQPSLHPGSIHLVGFDRLTIQQICQESFDLVIDLI
jgi:hypothetical protein